MRLPSACAPADLTQAALESHNSSGMLVDINHHNGKDGTLDGDYDDDDDDDDGDDDGSEGDDNRGGGGDDGDGDGGHDSADGDGDDGDGDSSQKLQTGFTKHVEHLHIKALQC